jgi:hypothetical protein
MADAGLFIGWDTPVRGREAQASESFEEALGYFQRLQEEGRIESFEPVFLEPHGGDLGGFILLRGEPEKLAAVRVSDEFTELIQRAALLVEGMGVVGASLAGRLQRQMASYREQVAALA